MICQLGMRIIAQRIWRWCKKHLPWSLLAIGLILSESIHAIPITYTLTPISGNLYRYTYTVSNDGSLGAGVAVELFDIDFPTDIYDESSLTIVTPSALTSSWSEMILASAPGAPAVYDVFALAGGIADGDGVAGFAVEFQWLGGPSGPGSQTFEVFDPNTFVLVQSGMTMTVPEPGMVLLVGTGLLILVWWRWKYTGCRRIVFLHRRQCRKLLLVPPLLVVPLLPTAHAADLSIDNNTLILVGSSRNGRTDYDLSYRATITNTGPKEVKAVTATLTSLSPHMVVVEGTLNFRTVPAGAKVTSSDTFTIRHDRQFPFVPAALVWTTATDQPENFYDVVRREDARFEALRLQRGDAFLSSEESGYGAYQFWKTYWEPKVTPHGNFQIVYDAMKQIPKSGLSQPSGACWRELGPVDMPLATNLLQGGCPVDERSRGIGRTTWIAFDPGNADKVFVGSPYGGLFYSTNAGATWQNGGTDFLDRPNLGVAHVAVDPKNSFHWFLATGDGDGIKDGRHDNGEAISHGVYRSLNKGLTWDKIGLDFSCPNGVQIKKLVIDLNDSNTIYATTSCGLYRTNNALALDPADVVWSLAELSATPFYDIAYRPGSTSTIYASGVKLVQSTDGGLNWGPLPNMPSFGTNVVRIAVEVTPANPDYLYVVAIQSGASARLYRFDASLNSWFDKGPVPGGVNPGQAHSIGVSPTNADLIFIGNVNPVYKCTNGGANAVCNWSATANTIHDDFHQAKFTPDGLTIYAATDGGVYTSVDEGVTWTPRSKGLGVANPLRMSTSVTNPELILGGHFDTGTVLYNDNTGTWTHAFCGDGLTPIIDPTDPTYMFASAQSGPMYRSSNQGFTFPTNVSLSCPNWSTFATLNPVTTTTVFGACHPEVVRSTTRGGNWLAISNFAGTVPLQVDLITGKSEKLDDVWKMYTAPSNQNYLYAHLLKVTTAGWATPVLMLTTNANAANVTWTNLSQGLPSVQWISDIDVDDSFPNKFWMTYAGFTPADKKVFYYDGSNYVNLTANLDPGLGVNSIVHQRGTGRLFIGTTRGVYSADPTLANWTWTRVGGASVGELPQAEVNELEINYLAKKLRVATRGRGTWEMSMDCQAAACVQPATSITNWWPFDETGGTTAADIIGGKDGEYAPSSARPTPVDGMVGKALAFDGGAYLTVDSSADLSHGNFFCSGFTIDAWIKTRQDTGVASILDKRTDPNAPVGYHLFLFNGRLGLQLADGQPTGSACGPETTNPCTNYVASAANGFVADGNWHHVAATVQVHGSKTFCPEVGKLYVDGTERFSFVPRTHSLNSGNSPGRDIANAAPLYIGRRDPAFSAVPEDDPAFFIGLIDELEFFRTVDENGARSTGALTQPEIYAIYAAGSAGKCGKPQ